MYQFTLILLCLFSPFFSQVYAPMSIRNFEFPIDDICSYQKSSGDFIYVEPCEKDHSCQEISNSVYPHIGICSKTSLEQPTYFGQACSTANDCYTGLKCVDNKCTLEVNDIALKIDKDNSGNNFNYYCPDNLIPVKGSGDTDFKCETRAGNAMDGLCYSNSGNEAYPNFMKVCGEITLDTSNQKEKVNVNSFGSVDNGKFVDNPLACKSGFALEFYTDGEISKTSPTDHYLKCVQFNGIENKKVGNCKVKYILDNKNYVYDVDKSDFVKNIATAYCSGLKFMQTKIDLFRQYVNKLNALGDGCRKSNYFDEPFTCRNDELRKLYFYMENTKEYLLYKNEDEITEYLIQNEYPSYGVKFSKTDGSSFITNKFIYLLILLFI